MSQILRTHKQTVFKSLFKLPISFSIVKTNCISHFYTGTTSA